MVLFIAQTDDCIFRQMEEDRDYLNAANLSEPLETVFDMLVEDKNMLLPSPLTKY